MLEEAGGPNSSSSVCSHPTEDIEYHTRRTVQRILDVGSMELCCSHCEAHPACGLWVWGKASNQPGFGNVCILREFKLDDQLTSVERLGVVSGFVTSRLSKHGWVAEVLSQGRARNDSAHMVGGAGDSCHGAFDMKGHGPVSVVSADWDVRGVGGHRVDVEQGNLVRPYLNSRGYLADNCSNIDVNSTRYSVLYLLGKKLKYTTDLSGAGCGCAAGLRLVPTLQTRLRTKCSDRACNAQDDVCWSPCGVVVLQMANQYAWSSGLQSHNDTRGASTGFGGRAAPAQGGGWLSEAFQPGSECVDTSWPFEVSVSFPVDDHGDLLAMEVVLSQDGKECPLAGHISRYDAPGGEDGILALSKLLAEGMTPVVEYSGSHHMSWLDGVDEHGVGPCMREVPEACGETVRFYNFALSSVSGPERRMEVPFGKDAADTGKMLSSVLYSIHNKISTERRAEEANIAASMSREERDAEARVTYRDMSSEQGTGSCADRKGRTFDCWWGNLPFGVCEEQCSRAEACLGFGFEFAHEHCRLWFGMGTLPAENPGPFNFSLSNRQGSGAVARVVDDGSDGRCFAKTMQTDLHNATLGIDITEVAPGNPEFEVVYDGDKVQVRARPSTSSKVLSSKPMGAVVIARRLPSPEDDWLKLANEPGYVKMSLENVGQVLRERRVTYVRVLSGAPCADLGLHPITDGAACQAAAFALGFFDTKIDVYSGEEPSPWGCHLKSGNLYLGMKAATADGLAPANGTEPLCASEGYVTSTTTTATTTTATATTTTTITTVTTVTTITTATTVWGWPSFFCYEVVKAGSFEVDMVRAQLRHRVSIFQCEHYTVFSNGGEVHLVDDWNATEISVPEVAMGNFADGATTESWLNAMIFIKAWELVKWDGRYNLHDWTIKVDPDAVFFPARLRAKVAEQTPEEFADGKKLYYRNCDLWDKISLYGSLEIFSRQALNAYYENPNKCIDELDWHGWGEDYFMQKCMSFLGVPYIGDFQMVADNRCHGAPCSDTSKVSFHDFKDVDGWFSCWDESSNAGPGEPIPVKVAPFPLHAAAS